MNCRYCDKPIPPGEEVGTFAYWSATPDVCHRACKDVGVRREAFECQLIDADCNDCRHYQRGRLAEKVVSLLRTKDGRIEEVIHKPNIIVGGHCLKFDRPTVAQPNKWSGLECFEHRRS